VNVQQIVDQIMEFLKGPPGWIALAAVIGFGFFLLRSDPPR
jgi:hypothetical protein